ncbi:MAG: exodeoxyribonuclease V subunit gamma [Gracilibacteraceae bacterium]|nr:exodeoxyribonuclease V subunit gamma [Gracilibacteraceae bacterium]
MRIIYGRAGCGKTGLCLTEISEHVQSDPDGPLLLLIVPEQATLQWEKELADRLGGLWRVQVLSFQRLARRILGEIGGSRKVRLSESGSHMLATKIMLEKRTELRRLAPLAASAGLAAEIARGIAELKSEGITPADLRDLRLPARDVREKVADLALIYSRYAETMTDTLGDGADLLTEAAAGLAACSFLPGAEVWVDGFTGFSWPERALLRALTAAVRQVSVTLPFAPATGGEIDIFAKPRRTYEQLTALAAETGAALTAVPLSPRAGSGALAHLERCLFRYPTSVFASDPGGLSDPPGAITLCCVADPRREAEYAAETVLRLAAENVSWERIAVATRDLSAYAPLLEQEFSRRAIPYFIDHKRSLTGHPLVALILALLELARAPWQEDALFAALKTGLFPPAAEEIDQLENYCLARGVEPWQWAAGRWPALPEALAPLARTVRDLLTPFLDRVRAAEVEPGLYGVEAVSRALYDCLERLRVPQTLAAWTEDAPAPGDVYAQTHAQVWRETVRLLDELVGILGGEAAPLTEYAAMVQSGATAIGIGVVPPRRREVQIGSLERSRLPAVDVLFLLGASEGVLPPRQADHYLDERDRLALRRAGLALPPRGRDGYFEEMFFIYNALSKARSRLYITRPLSDGAGREKTPSFLLARLKQLFPGLSERYIGRAKRAATVSAWNVPAVTNLAPEARRTLSGEWLQVSVTELERYAACPFGHFARDWLKLRERPRAEVGEPESGQLCHHALCEFGRVLSAAARQGEAVEADWCAARMNAMFERVVAEPLYEAFRRNSRAIGRAERIRQVLLYVAVLLGEHVRAGAFLPWAFEKKFGVEALWPPVATDDRFGVGGAIDRIDLARVGADSFLRVIDYKSSQTAFSLEQFHYGLSLQLPLYLEAALRYAADGHARPAGFLYFPVREPDITASRPLPAEEAARRKKRNTLPRGLLLDNKAALAAMDSNIGALGHSDLLNIHLSGRSGDTRGPDLLTARQMETLRRHLRRLLLNSGEHLLAGDVRIKPYRLGDKTGCQWCEYGAVCHFDPYLPEYGYRWLPQLNPSEIWPLWDREAGDNR